MYLLGHCDLEWTRLKSKHSFLPTSNQNIFTYILLVVPRWKRLIFCGCSAICNIARLGKKVVATSFVHDDPIH